jgi:exoribonuclease R
MENHIGKTFTGFISFINEYGCSVELSNGIEWFVHESTYPIRYLYDEERQILKAKRPEKSLFVWKPVSILVNEANKKSRRLYFTFSDIL